MSLLAPKGFYSNLYPLDSNSDPCTSSSLFPFPSTPNSSHPFSHSSSTLPFPPPPFPPPLSLSLSLFPTPPPPAVRRRPDYNPAWVEGKREGNKSGGGEGGRGEMGEDERRKEEPDGRRGEWKRVEKVEGSPDHLHHCRGCPNRTKAKFGMI